MTLDPRLLLRAAAVFNLAVAVAFFLAAPQVAHLLDLQPRPGPALYIQILAACIALFGWGYWIIAGDPVRYRPFLVQAMVGKLSVVAIIVAHVALGRANLALAGLGAGDLVFAVLFGLYLRDSRTGTR